MLKQKRLFHFARNDIFGLANLLKKLLRHNIRRFIMNYRIFSASAIAVLIIVAVLLSGPVIGGENPNKGSQPDSSTTTFKGTLLVKEGDHDILVRSDDLHQRRLKVKQSSVITRNGKPAKYEELQIRDQVRVSYDSNRVVVELDASGS